MNTLGTIYQNQLQTPPLFTSENALTQTLRDLAAAKYESQTAIAVLNDFFAKHRLLSGDFPFQKGSLTRSTLLREPNGFEIMVAHWDKGYVTPIHGHPGYSFSYVIEGELYEHFYLLERDRLMEVSTLSYTPGDYSYFNGDHTRFDNAIHQLTARKHSLSLHIYSNDALLGNVFTIV